MTATLASPRDVERYERDASSGNGVAICECCDGDVSVSVHARNEGICTKCKNVGCTDRCLLDDPSDEALGVEPRGAH